jgi:pimeloyl-ACP methyl ester carboxylesterase
MRVEGAGVELAYVAHGDGPATVVVHGMGAVPLVAGLPGRVIAYDRRGYGDSGAPEPYARTTVNEQAEDLACVIERLDAAPALLIGHDLGALVALDVLLRRPALARAAVLVDPPAYAFVAEATEALSEERGALEDAVRAGGPAAGLAWWLEQRGRAGREGTRDALAFFADYGALATLPLSYGGLLAVQTPVAIVTTDAARDHDAAAAEALLDALGNAHAAASVAEAVALLGA